MTTFLENRFDLTQKQFNAMLITIMLGLAFFVASFALAQTGNSTVIDDSLDSAWNELQSLATGNGGKILMILMILGGLYFSLIQPNGMYFIACVGGLLVLSNITELIDAALVSSFDAIPAISQLLQESSLASLQ